jgi:hypothetical protein
MAERRMFAKTIIDSDAFLEMPQSTQLLYFHLSMRADDDGFINNPKSIMRNVGCKEDDIRILSGKKFIIPFESGVVVIKHWRIHNYIQKDRYHETKYKSEKASLNLDENGAYTNCIQDVSKMDTQVRLELGKDRLGEDNKETPNKPAKKKNTEYAQDFETFWKDYPKREGKKEASKVFNAQVKDGVSLETILSRLAVYKARIKAQGTEYAYIRHPKTFLGNLEDYADGFVPQPKRDYSKPVRDMSRGYEMPDGMDELPGDMK